MTKYATTEKQFECPLCDIICTIREMKNDGGLMTCPNCNQLILFCPNPEEPSMLMGAVDDLGVIWNPE